jgi:hypothetical protein
VIPSDRHLSRGTRTNTTQGQRNNSERYFWSQMPLGNGFHLGSQSPRGLNTFKIIHWPSIWLLAGTCLTEDASAWSFCQSAFDISGIVEILPPDIMMFSQLLRLKPQVHFKVGSSFCKLQGPRSKDRKYGRHSIKEFTSTTWRSHPTRPFRELIG